MPRKTLKDLLTQQEIDDIIEKYLNNYSIREISRITHCSREALSKLLEQSGVKTTTGNHYRKYFFNFDYFHQIDSSTKAYWLGFLYADGCVLPKNRYGEQAFKLALVEKDRVALEYLKEDLNSTYPIRYDYSRHKKNPEHQIQVLLEQRSQKTVDDLKRLGCIENKSLILNFPTEDQVPREFIYDFIRGYFDGDGSISICYNKNHPNWTPSATICFVGTQDFITELSKYFDGGSIIRDKRKSNSFYFSIGGRLKVSKAYHLMYDNATRFLPRKHNRFQEFINKYSES